MVLSDIIYDSKQKYIYLFDLSDDYLNLFFLFSTGGLSALLRALIKSFNGHSEAFYARAIRPHRDRICHCDHYEIVGTSSPRDGRRRHCRYSVSGMQMAPSWLVICRLIRPALSRSKTPNYPHSRVERVCRTVRRNLGSYDNWLVRG